MRVCANYEKNNNNLTRFTERNSNPKDIFY